MYVSVLFDITSVFFLLIFSLASVFSSVGPFTVSCVSPPLLADLMLVIFLLLMIKSCLLFLFSFLNMCSIEQVNNFGDRTVLTVPEPVSVVQFMSC